MSGRYGFERFSTPNGPVFIAVDKIAALSQPKFGVTSGAKVRDVWFMGGGGIEIDDCVDNLKILDIWPSQAR